MAVKAQVIEALCKLLSTGDEADRCYACRALGNLGDRNAVPSLVEQLVDEDIDVCVDAAEALGNMGDPAAIPALLDSLRNDPEGEVKTAVVTALGRIDSDDTILPLLEVATSRPADMVFDETSDWDDWWDMQLKAIEVLGQSSTAEAVPVIKVILADEDNQDIESELLKALALIGGQGEEILIERLAEGTPRERRRAARALGLAQSGTSITLLGRTLKDPVAEVRSEAIQALANRRAKRYLKVILMLFRDRNPEVRSSAIEAARRLTQDHDNSDELSTAELLPLLSDHSAQVRKAALDAIATIPGDLDEHTRAAITRALGDKQADVAAAACDLLGSRSGPESAPGLVDILGQKNRAPALRKQAALALGKLGCWDGQTARALTQAITDDEQAVRLAALNALMDMEDAIPANNTTTVDGEETVQAVKPVDIVIAALRGKIVAENDPSDTASTTDTANTAANTVAAPEPHTSISIDESRPSTSTLESITRDNVEAALAMHPEDESPADSEPVIEDEQLHEYRELVEDNKQTGEWLFSHETLPVADDARRLAARILGNSNTALAVTALLEVLETGNPELIKDASLSLARIADRDHTVPGLQQAHGLLIELLDSTDRDLRISATRALGSLGNRDSISRLLTQLDDKSTAVRMQTIQSLAALATSDTEYRGTEPANTPNDLLMTVVKRLIALLADTEPGVRGTAVRELAPLLRNEALASDSKLLREAIEHTVQAAFSGDGSQARDMGRALREIDANLAADSALTLLENLPTSAERRFAIELLEEIFRTGKLPVNLAA